MSREIRAYYVNSGRFLVRQEGKPDHYIEKEPEMTLLDAVAAIARAHQADTVHIMRTNKPSEKPRVELFAYLPLDDEGVELQFPTKN
jgi:hypothetical protein